MLNVKKLLTKILQQLKAIETRKLLWTNSSPSSAFASQTISISNPSQYDALEIEFTDSVPNTVISMRTTSPFNVITPTWAAIPSYRAFSRNANGLYCSDAYSKSQTVSNGLLKPYRVYGIKLGGGTS